MSIRRQDQSIGVITYDHPHLKTEQVVHRLLHSGFHDITLFALPYSQRPERSVLISHRPNQSAGAKPDELAKANDLEFIEFDGKSELPNRDVYLITGAGVLPPEVVRKQRLINAHPGIIPSARGLDAFKWSIYHGIPLGITLHYIDEQVDAGQIISIFHTPMYPSDTILSLARRHYEIEIDILSNFNHYLENTSDYSFPVYDAHRRMPLEKEKEMAARFEAYKSKIVEMPSARQDL